MMKVELLNVDIKLEKLTPEGLEVLKRFYALEFLELVKVEVP